MPDTFTIKRGDTLPVMRGTLYADEAKTTPVDLSSAEHVRFIMSTGPDSPMKVSRPVTILEGGTSGRFEIQFSSSEVDEAIEYQGEFEVIWSETPLMKQTYPKKGFVTIIVHPDLGDPT